MYRISSISQFHVRGQIPAGGKNAQDGGIFTFVFNRDGCRSEVNNMEDTDNSWKNNNPDTFTVEKAAEWLSDINVSVSGTKEELIRRVKLYKRTPKLVEKLRSKTSRNRTFQTSLDPLTIPPIRAKWTNEGMLPKIDKDIFNMYCSHKKEGIQGQQEKAFRMSAAL